MNISPASVSIPTVAPSVNPPTEQVARENRVREKIVPTKQLHATDHEKPVDQNEKQLKSPSWDPAEHPDYAVTQKQESFSDGEFDGAQIAKQIDDLILRETGSDGKDENGYAMRLKLPKEVLEKIEELKKFERTRAVVAMRYQQSTVANSPSEVLIVI